VSTGIGDICEGFEHAGVSVGDLDAMSAWYQETLGMVLELRSELPERGARSVILRGASGDYRLELIEIAGSVPNPNGAPLPSDSLRFHGYGHLALRVSQLEEAYEGLLAAGAASVIAPREPPVAEDVVDKGDPMRSGAGAGAVRVRHAYVTDPEGNQIELMEYP
jgi:catechol 2,3-dioxygenase-like lactoylglutathione lyase family enzyme